MTMSFVESVELFLVGFELFFLHKLALQSLFLCQVFIVHVVFIKFLELFSIHRFEHFR